MSEMRCLQNDQVLSPEMFLEGCLIAVDKPTDWTSFDVVNKLRWTLRNYTGEKKIKVGHSGTLDPLATGLLLICTGKWTKRLAELQGLDKAYTGTMKLGQTTPSYDAETAPDSEAPIEHITEDEIIQAARQFVGSIDQLPPMYSALKVQGKPLYKLARKGKEVEVEPRKVRIESFEILEYSPPVAGFSVKCSKGTYIRSLAHDLGKQLGCGAHLVSLRRTQIGSYRLEDAWQLQELVDAISRDTGHLQKKTVS